LGSDVDYDLLTADVSKTDISMGIFGKTSFYVAAGKFLNSNSVFYPDYQQFSGNQILFSHSGINTFLLLNYYQFSTYTEFVEGHFEHNFSGFILNKIPLIRKLKIAGDCGRELFKHTHPEELYGAGFRAAIL